ncbi:MAG: hypothetical protein ACLRPX_11855 [Ruthenibacterium sp.]
MMKALNTMKVSFPSRSANEGFARSGGALRAGRPTMDELADIKTAVSEAVIKIVHAYPNVIGPVTLTTCDGVRIVVADKGCGMTMPAMRP